MNWDHRRLIIGIFLVTLIVLWIRSVQHNWSWSDRRNYLRSQRAPIADERSSLARFNDIMGKLK